MKRYGGVLDSNTTLLGGSSASPSWYYNPQFKTLAMRWVVNSRLPDVSKTSMFELQSLDLYFGHRFTGETI